MNRYWKWILGASLVLNVIVVPIAVFSGDEKEVIKLSDRTQQKIENAMSIEIGMPSEKVKQIMGKPIKRDAENANEEWYYCRTGINVDEYVQISLLDKKVIKINNYSVTGIDTGGAIGDCELFIKTQPSKNTPNNVLNRTQKKTLRLFS